MIKIVEHSHRLIKGCGKLYGIWSEVAYKSTNVILIVSQGKEILKGRILDFKNK